MTAAAPRAVVFDVGGVLIDADYRHLCRKLLEGDVQHNVEAARGVGFRSTVFTDAEHSRRDLVACGLLTGHQN